jgi:hypothetical protein
MPRKIAGSPFSLPKQTIRELSRPEIHIIRGAWEYEECRQWATTMQRPVRSEPATTGQPDLKECR